MSRVLDVLSPRPVDQPCNRTILQALLHREHDKHPRGVVPRFVTDQFVTPRLKCQRRPPDAARGDAITGTRCSRA